MTRLSFPRYLGKAATQEWWRSSKCGGVSPALDWDSVVCRQSFYFKCLNWSAHGSETGPGLRRSGNLFCNIGASGRCLSKETGTGGSHPVRPRSMCRCLQAVRSSLDIHAGTQGGINWDFPLLKPQPSFWFNHNWKTAKLPRVKKPSGDKGRGRLGYIKGDTPLHVCTQAHTCASCLRKLQLWKKKQKLKS